MQQSRITLSEVNRLAIPSMLAGITEPLIGIADTAIIGHLPENSAEALAGIGVASGFFLFVFWTFVQIETALSAIVARYYGEKKTDSLQSLVGQALVLNIIVGLLLCIITQAFSSTIFDWYNAIGLQKKYAMDYYHIRAWGFPIVMMLWAIWGIFRGLQNTSWAMFIMIGGGVVNLVLDILLVFGVDGLIAPMGVEGAAWASFIAQGFMLLLSLWTLRRKTPFRLNTFWPIHPAFPKMLSMGSSFIVRTIALNLVFFVASATATSISPQTMAAHAIAIQLWLLSAFLIDGYANAGLALAGRLLGETRWDAIADLTGRLVRIGFIVSLGLMVAFGAVYPWLGTWFSNEALVVDQFNSIFWLVIISQPLSALAFTLDGFLKGLGAATYLMIMMIVAFITFYVVIRISEVVGAGFAGIWIALMVWMAVRSIWPYFYMRARLKKEMTVGPTG